LTDEEVQRRALSREARRLSVRIDEVSASLAERESRIAELEAKFADPERFKDSAEIADSAEQYRVLKEEEESFFEEWERLSLEAESIDGQLAALTELIVTA
jgi:hypothetical protein